MRLIIPLSERALINGDWSRAYLCRQSYRIVQIVDNVTYLAFDLDTVKLLMNIFVCVI